MINNRKIKGAEQKRIQELEKLKVPSRYAKRIASLEMKAQKTSQEKRELQLLVDFKTTRYASMISFLEFNPNRTEKESRTLQLLHVAHMRPYAIKIASELEPKVIDLSSGEADIEVTKQLMQFYFYQTFEIPFKIRPIILSKSNMSSCHSPLFQESHHSHEIWTNRFDQDTTSLRLESQFELFKKQTQVTAEQIVNAYLAKKGVPSHLILMPKMQDFIAQKTILLTLSLQRHFAQYQAGNFNDLSIKEMQNQLIDEINQGSFSLETKSLMHFIPLSSEYKEEALLIKGPSFFRSKNDQLMDSCAQRLADHGVTTAFIRKHWKKGTWSEIYSELLISLINKHQLSPLKALLEMANLSTEQAEALNTLYAHGLRGAHLRNYSELFQAEAKHALMHLMLLQQLPADEAMQRLEKLNLAALDELGAAYILQSPPRQF